MLLSAVPIPLRNRAHDDVLGQTTVGNPAPQNVAVVSQSGSRA
jgi:hypothetical protein